MDNCAGHDINICDPTGQVEIIFFPPNCTSVYQPLDQGIISTLKTIYKKEMLSEFVVAYEKREELEVLASQVNFHFYLFKTMHIKAIIFNLGKKR